MKQPHVAVVIPAYNAEDTLGRTLAAVIRQDGMPAYEVIVVDDHSTDATATTAHAAGATVVRPAAQGGPAAARNVGAASTTATVLAFTDADCEPSPVWLRESLAALDAGADLITGPIKPVRPPGPFDRTLDVEGPSRLFETANLVVRREVFDRVGGFRRPSFLRAAPPAEHFGEDVVFGWTARRIGARVEHAPGALVRHEVFARKPVEFVKEAWRLRHFPPLLAEVPELRAELPLRMFLSPRTAYFDLGVAALVASRMTHRVGLLALVAPYLAVRMRGGALTLGGLKRNLAFAAFDAVGLAALLHGSASSRSPVL